MATVKRCCQLLTEGKGITGEQAETAIDEIMDGKATQAQVGKFLHLLEMTQLQLVSNTFLFL